MNLKLAARRSLVVEDDRARDRHSPARRPAAAAGAPDGAASGATGIASVAPIGITWVGSIGGAPSTELAAAGVHDRPALPRPDRRRCRSARSAARSGRRPVVWASTGSVSTGSGSTGTITGRGGTTGAGRSCPPVGSSGCRAGTGVKRPVAISGIGSGRGSVSRGLDQAPAELGGRRTILAVRTAGAFEHGGERAEVGRHRHQLADAQRERRVSSSRRRTAPSP